MLERTLINTVSSTRKGIRAAMVCRSDECIYIPGGKRFRDSNSEPRATFVDNSVLWYGNQEFRQFAAEEHIVCSNA